MQRYMKQNEGFVRLGLSVCCIRKKNEKHIVTECEYIFMHMYLISSKSICIDIHPFKQNLSKPSDTVNCFFKVINSNNNSCMLHTIYM